jgi:hypothetical protein
MTATDGGPWRGTARREWVKRFMEPDEPVPDAPPTFHVQQIGLTSHLCRIGVFDRALCGTVSGDRPYGPAIALCLDCRAIAR